ncbi:MAG: hypothetical protein KDA58_06985 [Planctomycetaceae bacterium]|nr:hypothetical protein [Planctomycetaceae bacterium]
MHIGNLQSSSGRIQDALEVLLIRWDETREVWKDQRAERFDEEVIQPLREQIAIATPAIGHITQVIARARREVEE